MNVARKRNKKVIFVNRISMHLYQLLSPYYVIVLRRS